MFWMRSVMKRYRSHRTLIEEDIFRDIMTIGKIYPYTGRDARPENKESRSAGNQSQDSGAGRKKEIYPLSSE